MQNSMKKQRKDTQEYELGIKSYFQNNDVHSLWDWQRSIINLSAFLAINQGIDHIVKLPTGCGKTIIIACLAHILAVKYPESNVYIVCPSPFLKFYSYKKFGNKSMAALYPNIRRL